MSRFIGRQQELKRLLDATRKRTASFIVLKGRRRIGKSRLIEEFGKNFQHHYVFTGLPPDKATTAANQLGEFSRQVARQFRTPPAQYQDWSDALWAVAERVQSGKVLLLLDEISWMGSEDAAFLGKIKDVWDQRLQKNAQLILIVCGSASAWIEKNLLSSTGFVGRISYTLTLEELPLCDSDKFWPANVSAYEKFKLLALTGGVSKYLGEIDPKLPAEENIRRLCFTRGGFLVDEFERISADIFLRGSDDYRRIVDVLSSGSKEVSEIQQALHRTAAGRIPEYSWELELAGVIARDYAWSLISGDDAKLSRYRLKGNYLRFYLKYIKKNIGKIARDNNTFKSLTSLPEWHAMMGLQFENLVLNSRRQIQQLLNLNADEIVNDNPFYQRKTLRQPGCQVDYLIQMKFGTLYVCEIKFSKNEITNAVISEVQAKIAALALPKGTSCRPVLIHVNGVSTELLDSDYFAAMIDMTSMLKATADSRTS